MKTLQSQFVWISVGLSFAGCLVTSNGSLLYAQTIRPAADGTGTIVLPNGNQIDISGGQRSRNGANLFHSFQEFGLSPGQIANFLASPELKAIFARVAGGNPSVIDGLLQVTGSTAHLYLLNPSGIVFGSNASLNVPGSFTATTANGVRFGTQWYDAIGANNYLNLGGTPDGLVLTAAQPGAIVNAGNLAVGTGRSLNLVGGTVVNTGSLTAPAGQVTIAAVPGNRLVRLSSPGSLLSFEVNPTTPLQALPSRPATLPQLLTGGNLENATNLVVRNGQVFLSGMTRPADTAPGRVTVAGRVNASGQTGGSITILGQQVDLPRATIQATGVGNGGTVRIGGDYKGQGSLPQADRTLVDSATAIDVSSQRNGNGGRAIVWAKDVTGFYGDINAQGGSQRGNGGFVEVSGKRFLIFDGNVNLNAPNGQVGTLLLDPENIRISNEDTAAGVNPSQVLSGEFNGGNITIYAVTLQNLTGNIRLEAIKKIEIREDPSLPPLPIFPISPNSSKQAKGLNFANGSGNIIFDAGEEFSIFPTVTINGVSEPSVIQSRNRSIFISAPKITTGNVFAVNGNVVVNGNINPNKSGDISMGEIRTVPDRGGNGGNITITSSGNLTINAMASWSNKTSGAIELKARGSITLNCVSNYCVETFSDDGAYNPGTIENNINDVGTSGNISFLSETGDISITGISGAVFNTINHRTGNAGSITLSSSQGSIYIGSGNLDATSKNGSGNGGFIQLEAQKNITVPTIDSSSTQGRGGNITATSQTGNVTINGSLSSTGAAQSGFVQLDARQTVTTGDIDSSSTQGRGGNISVTSTSGGVSATGTLSSNGASQGGDIQLDARQAVTTGAIDSSSTQGRGGSITATSTAGEINTTGTLSSNGASQGGTVQLNARQTVTTGAIDSSSTQGRGGSITATSQAGNVTVNGTLSSVSTNGTGGAIDLTGQNLTLQGDITLGSRSGRGGGDFTLNTPGQVTFPSTISTNGANLVSTQSLNTLLPQLTSTINTGGGNVSFQFSSNVSLGKALSINTSGGDITLTSPGNLSVLGTLNTSSTTGAGGNISLTSVNGAVTSGDLTASGTSGGNVTVQALTAITAGRINTSATVGKGGNVTLDPIGDVQVTSIDARGGPSGSGGTVDITAQQFVRITGLIDNSNASISATGGQPGGSITIRHGGQGITPFIVGNAALNGSAGILTTGLDNSITSGNFYFTYSQSGPSGVIRIISVDPTPLPYNDPLDELCQGKKCQPDDLSGYIFDIEQRFTRLYEPILGTDKPTKIKTLNEIRDELRNIEKESGVKPAIIYADFKPADSHECNSPGLPLLFINEQERKSVPQNSLGQSLQDNDRLEIALVTAQNSVICKRIPNVTKQQVAKLIKESRSVIKNSAIIDASDYRATTETLYQWFVRALQTDIQKEGIKNLVFILHPTLQNLPLAAIHNGQHLLIKDYSLGYMPSMSLTDAKYADIRSAKALLMGTSDFPEIPAIPNSGEEPLSFAPFELNGIQKIWQPSNSKLLRDQDFTVENLKRQQTQKQFGIIHLATHAQFSSGKIDDPQSYIYFRDQRLRFDIARQINWQNLELLILSACNSATGNEQQELGFAGFAAKAGVKSVLASLWKVDDEATAMLMLLFYNNLNDETTRIKAQALQQAQLDMLRGQTVTKLRPLLEQLKQTGIPFPPNFDLQNLDGKAQEWQKPYYWSGFTIVGNPW